jgi:hypothetical protein
MLQIHHLFLNAMQTPYNSQEHSGKNQKMLQNLMYSALSGNNYSLSVEIEFNNILRDIKEEIVKPSSNIKTPILVGADEFKAAYAKMEIQDKKFLNAIVKRRFLNNQHTDEDFKNIFLYAASVFRDFRVFEEIKKSRDIAADNKLVNDTFYFDWVKTKGWLYLCEPDFYSERAHSFYQQLISKYLNINNNLELLNYIAYNRDFPGRTPRPLMNKPFNIREMEITHLSAIVEHENDIKSKYIPIIHETIEALSRSLNKKHN